MTDKTVSRLKKSSKKQEHKVPALEYIFHPRSLALIGASPNSRNQSNFYLREFKKFGFKGDIYLVNPRYKEIMGMPVYPSLTDVPGDVDYVISCVPADLVPPLMEECKAKKVKVLHLYTGRMAEMGLEDKKKIQDDVVATARSSGMRVIGPNCMGLYYAPEGLSFRMSLPTEAGKIGFISQSGGNCAELVYKGGGRGLKFSKAVSYGNASDLNEYDFIEYFMEDPETEVIAAYIEGIKEGEKFFKLAREAARKKPLVILKGGRTDAGKRAAASHTASLASSDIVWDAFCHQIGAVRADSMDELSDLLVAFTFMHPPAGSRVLCMGGGGGNGVSSADSFEADGLELPGLPSSVIEEMKKLVPQVWSMFGNPVDFSILGGSNFTALQQICKMAASNELYDLIIGNLGAEWPLDEPAGTDWIPNSVNAFIEMKSHTGKPTAVVLSASDSPESWRWEAVMKAQEECVKEGLPVFGSVDRAAKALGKYIDYYKRRRRLFR
jgi:acyl-CoA synthetase (NDP forming)